MDEISLAQLSAERVSQNNCQMTGSSENVKNEKNFFWANSIVHRQVITGTGKNKTLGDAIDDVRTCSCIAMASRL